MLNVSFTVVASSANPPLSYQWRARGTNLLASTKYSGPNTATLTISNVTMDDFAEYSCAITDNNGTIYSTNATLYPLVRPTILLPLLNQTQIVATASPFPISAVLSNGWPPPFGYQWRSNALPITNLVSNSKTNFFVYPGYAVSTNVFSGALYRLVVTNRANPAPGANVIFYVTTLLDSDHDGIPDSVETSPEFGLNPNDPADALLDPDHDGVSNLGEYQSGTLPNVANSYLRIDHQITAGAAMVYFEAVSNRTYTVQYTDVLMSNPLDTIWQRLADVVAKPTNHFETFLDPGWTTNRFYRVAFPRR